MTAYSELKQRARARSHDISDPVASADGALSTESKTGKDVAERRVGRVIRNVPVEADTAAATVIGERPVISVPSSLYPNGAKVVEIQMRDSVAVTADDTDYATDTFTNRDYLGVSNLVVATVLSKITGGTGDTVAQKKVALTLGTLANCTIPPDGCLTLTRAKAGATGVQLPDRHYCVVLEAL